MSSGFNRVTLIGNLGKPPEVRYTQSGAAVCNLRLAVGERKKEGEQWVDHTEWIDVVCFGKTAENAGQYLDKGRQIFVEGRMQTRKWTDKEGKDRYSTEVVGDRVLFLGGGDRGVAGAPAKAGGKEEAPAAAGSIDDDMPF